MSIHRPILIWASITVIVIIVGASITRACSCADSPLLERYERAEYAFLGTAVAKCDLKAGASTHSSADPIAYTFSVEMAWKGVDADTIVVWSPRSGASCGYRFEIGGRYVVLADDRAGKTTTGMCSGNAPLERALSARYLLPFPTPIVPGAVWPAVSRDELLYLLNEDEGIAKYSAASLLADEFKRPDIRLLSLARLLVAAPLQLTSILSAGRDSASTVAAFIELGFELVQSDSAKVRAAAVESLGLLTWQAELDQTLRLGLADPAEPVRYAARLVLVSRYDDLTTPQADDHVSSFMASIGKIEEKENWIGVHQLAYFPNQREQILPFLSIIADTTTSDFVRRVTNDVYRELSED